MDEGNQRTIDKQKIIIFLKYIYLLHQFFFSEVYYKLDSPVQNIFHSFYFCVGYDIITHLLRNQIFS